MFLLQSELEIHSQPADPQSRKFPMRQTSALPARFTAQTRFQLSVFSPQSSIRRPVPG
jgi:hypothetical protein